MIKDMLHDLRIILTDRTLRPMVAVAVLVLITALVFFYILAMGGFNCSSNSFECRHEQVTKCLESELYTRDECIALVGGGGAK